MTNLLTWNGIPPQIVGSPSEAEQRVVLSYASANTTETYPPQYWQLSGVMPSAISPFVSVASRITDSFTGWGAVIDQEASKINLISSFLRAGNATFNDDQQLHSDSRLAMSNLESSGRLVVRLLCVSSIPATFIDLTGRTDMRSVLDAHYTDDTGRFLAPDLLTLAQAEGRTITPKPFDIIVFDGTTPHKPQAAIEPHQRVFQQAWIEMDLPSDWRDRLGRGDGPQLNLG